MKIDSLRYNHRGHLFGKAYLRRGIPKEKIHANKEALDPASSSNEDISEEVALISQVEESISGARNKNSNSNGNGYMETPSKEVCKSFAGVASTVGCPIGLEGSQVQGRQEVANSNGSGELPMHIYS
ncbi:hypothetical protein U1Q18_011630 [Sarracenia purpurea var. burkii]